MKRNEQLVYFQDKYDFLKQKTYAQIHEQTKKYRYENQEIHFLNFSPTHNKAEFAAIYTKSPENSRVCSQKSRKSNSDFTPSAGMPTSTTAPPRAISRYA